MVSPLKERISSGYRALDEVESLCQLTQLVRIRTL